MKKKIMLVDDELDFLEVMGGRIRSWGYEVIPVSSGEEAIEKVKGNGIDIIILDYMMPVMDGIGTLREIRRIDKTIPVIVFTAYPVEDTMKEAEKLGVSAFIPKLSSYSDTQAALKSALEMIDKKIFKGKR
ncbi:MAG: response regulator [Candidatus Omnitrophica bacterium]|nr:response regulator [Candidatus Omnitrophota bacterium]